MVSEEELKKRIKKQQEAIIMLSVVVIGMFLLLTFVIYINQPKMTIETSLCKQMLMTEFKCIDGQSGIVRQSNYDIISKTANCTNLNPDTPFICVEVEE